MTDDMLAAVLTAPRRCEARRVPRPVPKPDEVLIAVEGCGVCGSNLPRWEGRPWFEYPAEPGAPGHEGWGRIAGGAGKVGQRVAFLSNRAFAEYDVAPASAVVPLPASLDGMDVPGEPLGCAINIWRRADIRPGHTVAIVGFGFLGALVAQLALRAGAFVIAVTHRPYSRTLAQKLGAVALDLPGAAAYEERCDRVVEVAGVQDTLDVATKLCRVRARLVIAGFHQDGPRSVDMFLWNWRGLDVVNAHEREPEAYVDGMTEAIAQVVAGRLSPEPLYTHRIPLARAGDAFSLLADRPAGFVKAVVLP